ncbi:unnamed protein product [Musa textilis]
MALNGFQEGFSVFRPPFFNGSDYTYWKTRMRVFMLSMDLDLWNIIKNCFQLPSKPTNEWSDLERKSFSLNAKAMNALFCVLNKNEFNRISSCETTFDIWRTLKIMHEGTSRIIDSKVNLLLHDFELFRMTPSETIDDMYTRFTDVVNSLKSLGKSFSSFDLVNKILRSLPKEWDPKITAIQESKNLNDYSLEELIGSLMTYEMTLLKHDEHDEHLNHLLKNKKVFELRTREYHLSDDSNDEDNEEDFEPLIDLNKFIKQKSKINNKLEQRNRPMKKKKAHQEEANYALMGFDNEVSNLTSLNYFEIT